MANESTANQSNKAMIGRSRNVLTAPATKNPARTISRMDFMLSFGLCAIQHPATRIKIGSAHGDRARFVCRGLLAVGNLTIFIVA